MGNSSIYGRLYKYRESENRSKLENFLTEGLADLLQRDTALSKDFICEVLLKNRTNNSQASPDALGQTLARAECLEWRPQKSFEGMKGRPDISVFTNDDGKIPIIILENKISAGFTHSVSTDEEGTKQEYSQLEVYGT